jgi:hypothetical protein
MRLVRPKLIKVWTSRRKWLGNVVPMLFWIAPTAGGLYWIIRTTVLIGPGLWVLIAGQIAGWLALNLFGLFENGRIRRDSMRNLAYRQPPAPGPVVFVGCASTRHHSLLDAHEDVGFLSFGKYELEFIGDDKRMRILREQVQRIHFLPNVHSIMGLGRWIAVEATIGGLPVRLLVEPREKDTMLGNLLISGWLKHVIDEWRAGHLPEPKNLRHAHEVLPPPTEPNPDSQEPPDSASVQQSGQLPQGPAG